ncbi:MAG TPA: DUF2285 domain-containing protein [Sphingomonas sp.]|uniref:DUF2285 domain-containing protein n=1 Tax=Sphingomonas sp. TaxID=28214 RepID=UPI002C714F8D|nr:DUF2285 domain-containing protein [Sphingomonas sp.]HMI20858.1 DUF2285 domain-containing protein [Sphingomonas sp.]
MSALPDGTRAADYACLREVDRAGLMWEWLRRDPDYISWYGKASTATRGARQPPSRWSLLFRENPDRIAPKALIVWRADIDPGTLRVIAAPTRSRDPDGLPLHSLRRWISLVPGMDGREHAVLSDGLHHLRLDVEQGTLAGGPVVLHYLLHGTRDARPKLRTLRRLTAISLERRFTPSLFPADPRQDHWLWALRVGDALREGASQREIAEILYGPARTRGEWQGHSDSLRSRVRRLVGEARRLASGDYRKLMRPE